MGLGYQFIQRGGKQHLLGRVVVFENYIFRLNHTTRSDRPRRMSRSQRKGFQQKKRGCLLMRQPLFYSKGFGVIRLRHHASLVICSPRPCLEVLNIDAIKLSINGYRIRKPRWNSIGAFLSDFPWETIFLLA